MTDGHRPFSLPDMASSDIPMQIAETIQTAHIKREPSAAHDINPSTAADTREPVRLEEKKARDVDEEDDDDEIPVSVLRPQRRFSHLPPIPSVKPGASRVAKEYMLTLSLHFKGPTVRTELFAQYPRCEVVVDGGLDHVQGSGMFCFCRPSKKISMTDLGAVVDHDAHVTRSCLQSRLVWLATLE